MTTPPLILAFDPSLSCTGFAVVRGEQLLDAGRIAPDPSGGHPYERLLSVRDQAQAVVDGLDKIGEVRDGIHRTGPIKGTWELTCIVVEWPRTNEARTQDKRKGGDVATYAMAVWAVASLRVPAHVPVLTPSVTDWTRGYPSTVRDPHKEKRVSLAESIYGLAAGDLGPKSAAGNVADAALLAHWVNQRLKFSSVAKLLAETRKTPVRRQRGRSWEKGLGAA